MHEWNDVVTDATVFVEDLSERIFADVMFFAGTWFNGTIWFNRRDSSTGDSRKCESAARWAVIGLKRPSGRVHAGLVCW